MIFIHKSGDISNIQHTRKRVKDEFVTVFDPEVLYKRASTTVSDGFAPHFTWNLSLYNVPVCVRLYGKLSGPKNMINAYAFPKDVPQMYGHCILVAFPASSLTDVVTITSDDWKSIWDTLPVDSDTSDQHSTVSASSTSTFTTKIEDGGESDGGESDGGESDGGENDGGESDGGESDGGDNDDIHTADGDIQEEMECDRAIIQQLIDVGIVPEITQHGYVKDGFIVSDSDSDSDSDSGSETEDSDSGSETEDSDSDSDGSADPDSDSDVIDSVVSNQGKKKAGGKRIGRVILDDESVPQTATRVWLRAVMVDASSQTDCPGEGGSAETEEESGRITEDARTEYDVELRPDSYL